MSKELTTIYKCDRCGKQMESQYAILTLKHAGYDDFINKDLCVDCFDKISKLINDKKAMIITMDNSWFTIRDSSKDVAPLERGTYITWTGNDPMNKQSGTWKTDPLNKHLDVTCL